MSHTAINYYKLYKAIQKFHGSIIDMLLENPDTPKFPGAPFNQLSLCCKCNTEVEF